MISVSGRHRRQSFGPMGAYTPPELYYLRSNVIHWWFSVSMLIVSLVVLDFPSVLPNCSFNHTCTYYLVFEGQRFVCSSVVPRSIVNDVFLPFLSPRPGQSETTSELELNFSLPSFLQTHLSS